MKKSASKEELCFSLCDYERLATQVLPNAVYDFCAGGSGNEHTIERNLSAFREYSLIPRVLKGVERPDLSTELFGRQYTLPLLSAPMALQASMCQDAEIALAKACHDEGIGLVVSTMSTESLENLEHESGLNKWFQLYVFKDRSVTRNLLKQLSAFNYGAILLTVDVPIMATRRRDLRNGFAFPSESLPTNLINALAGEQDVQSATVQATTNVCFDATLTWNDIQWIRQETDLPLLLKGILHPDDAHKAMEMGVDGIVLSNHGGRQLDSCVSPLDVITNIRQLVGPDFPLLVDGGIRSGIDILKAILLGANAVLIGRPLLWGLAARGQTGVGEILRLMGRELFESSVMMGIQRLRDSVGCIDCLSRTGR